MVILPSFVQTADASCWGGICYDDQGRAVLDPGESIGRPIDDPWDWPDNPNPHPGEECDQIGCDSEDEDDDDTDPPDFCSNKSTSNGFDKNSEPCTKDEYCKVKGKAKTFLRAVNIINTANTISTIGGIFADYGLSSLRNGYWDIESYLGGSYDHRPYYGNLNASIDWYEANIDWRDYDESWSDMNRGYPTRANGGAQHIMAEYMFSLGIGNGNGSVVVPASLLPVDPDPGTPCN